MTDLLRDQIYADLKDEILTSTHSGGERLVISELVEKYGVSATPIRQVLNLLQSEDLVDIIPGVGCFVSRLSVKDVKDIFELRLIIEAASAELAASRITDDQLAELEAFHVGYDPDDVDSYTRFLAENRDFHTSVARATGNKWLTEAVGRLLDQMNRASMLRLLRTGPDYDMVEEHRELVRALRARDGDEARDAMVRAIENARQAVLQHVMDSDSHFI